MKKLDHFLHAKLNVCSQVKGTDAGHVGSILQSLAPLQSE